MVDKPSETTKQVSIKQIDANRVALEFKIEDVLQQLLRVSVASCMGCKGCMASQFERGL